MSEIKKKSKKNKDKKKSKIVEEEEEDEVVQNQDDYIIYPSKETATVDTSDWPLLLKNFSKM